MPIIGASYLLFFLVWSTAFQYQRVISFTFHLQLRSRCFHLHQ